MFKKAIALSILAFTIGCGQGEAPVPPASSTATDHTLTNSTRAESPTSDSSDTPSSNDVPLADSKETIAKSTAQSDPDEPSVYFPLVAAKKLKYDVVYRIFLLGEGKGKLTTDVKPEKLDGEQYYAQTSTLTGTSWDFSKTDHYRLTPEGVMVRDQRTNTDRLFMPLPLEVGTAWSTKTGDGVTEHKVLAREDVIFGKTTYHACLKVQSTPQGGSPGTSWYAPGVGVVKVETAGSHFTSSSTLTEVE